ncbi:MAG: flagellar hook-basal body protein [Defluviitaleaceae bacterium]|nr:flagellar hook-basal body protein [Defluviitaleaceae bacterium]MCL2261835.1 flagellar hook-basal body protein [Defluviitaleaceae bacterium]
MIRGIYTSALGMITNMQRMDVVSQNMANVNTTGHKRDHVVSHAFSDVLLARIDDPGHRMFKQVSVGTINPGVFIDDVFTDFSQGAFIQTGNALDMALAGQGFFVVNLDGEEFFTRDGAFTLAHGTLMTADGALVQGENGNIVLPDGYISVSDRGRIYVNDEYVTTLRFVNFSAPEGLHSLRKMQDNLFRTSEHTQDDHFIPFTGSVQQGFLEGSNVNIVQEMVEMITVSRAFETNSRVFTLQDGTLQRAVNDIARRQ